MAFWKLTKPPRAVAVLVGSLGLLLAGACAPAADDAAPANIQASAPAPTATAARILPAPPALTRGDLLAAAAKAGSAYSEGRAVIGNDPLVGRTFAVRLPFGCNGPTRPTEGEDASGLGQWHWSADNKTVELTLTPGDWTASAWLADGEKDRWEAVEGYWVARPWLTAETCPDVRGDPLSTAPGIASPQTLGLAAVYETGGSRIGRRNGRAYNFPIRGKDDAAPAVPSAGFRLLLEGRVGEFEGGRAIRCRAGGPDERPVCVIAVKLDRVAFEDAAGALLSDWRTG